MRKIRTITLLLLISISHLGFTQHITSDGSKKFDALLQIINYTYVDTTNENDLVEDAIVAVLKELDLILFIFLKKN